MIIKYIAVAALCAIALFAHPVIAATVCVHAESAYIAPTSTCTKVVHPQVGLLDGYTSIDCAEQHGIVINLPIPPGSGFQYRTAVQYRTTDETPSKACTFSMNLLSTISHCTGGSNPGTACMPGDAICVGGGTCTVPMLEGYPNNFVSPVSLTQQHNDLGRYWTQWSSWSPIFYDSDGSGVPIACTTNRCRGVMGRSFILNHQNSTAANCNWSSVCFDFP